MSQSAENKAPIGLNHTVKALRDLIAHSPVLKDVCLAFSQRERARRQVTIARLAYIMKEHGFEYQTKDLRSALSSLAAAGVGKLDKGPTGQIRALKEIRYTLQSVGKAALEQEDKIISFRPQDRIQRLPAQGANSEAMEAMPEKIKMVKKHPVYLVAIVDGKKQAYQVGLNLTKEEIGKVILELVAEYQTETL